MPFTRAQQPEFRQLVTKAWQAHCRANGIDPTTKQDRTWYEAELVYATSHHSTADCNAGRDYDRAMAHFEAIAGDSIKWAMKIHGGDANRLLHTLSQDVRDHGIDEDYLRAIAKRRFKLDHLPELSRLKRDDLILILGEAKRYARRHLKASKAQATASPEGAPDPDWTV